MKLILATVMATVLLVACSQPSPRAELHQTMEDMLSLLNKGKTIELQHNYAYKKHTQLKDEPLPPRFVRRMTAALTEARSVRPQLSKNNTVAVYKISSMPEHQLEFIKVDGHWRLK